MLRHWKELAVKQRLCVAVRGGFVASGCEGGDRRDVSQGWILRKGRCCVLLCGVKGLTHMIAPPLNTLPVEASLPRSLP